MTAPAASTDVVQQELSGNERAAQRWSKALMDNFGVPPVESSMESRIVVSIAWSAIAAHCTQ